MDKWDSGMYLCRNVVQANQIRNLHSLDTPLDAKLAMCYSDWTCLDCDSWMMPKRLAKDLLKRKEVLDICQGTVVGSF